MKRDRNQYRNQVRATSVMRWILAGLILGGFGVGYVYIKNNHVELGVRRGQLEEEIATLARQIDEAKGWSARMVDRRNLHARLQRADSELVNFAPSRVIKIRPVTRPQPTPATDLSAPEERSLPEGAISGELAQNE